MPDLPGDIFTVLFTCGIGLALVVALALREFRFSYHQRRGIKLFKEGCYQAALRHLIQAERLWMLRLSKQTRLSRIEDCRNLGAILELIAEAAKHCSLQIEATEYRMVVVEMERFFTKKSPPRDYPQIHSAFSRLRKQFRCDTGNILACCVVAIS